MTLHLILRNLYVLHLSLKKSKLFCTNVTLDNTVLEYIGRTKYFGFMCNSNRQDDEDMLKQMRNFQGRI